MQSAARGHDVATPLTLLYLDRHKPYGNGSDGQNLWPISGWRIGTVRERGPNAHGHTRNAAAKPAPTAPQGKPTPVPVEPTRQTPHTLNQAQATTASPSRAPGDGSGRKTHVLPVGQRAAAKSPAVIQVSLDHRHAHQADARRHVQASCPIIPLVRALSTARGGGS